MRDRITFLLHQDADEAYAVALAEALAPRAVFASPISMAQGLGFGAGAACVALWTPEWSAHGSAASLVELMMGKGSNALIVSLRNAPTAPEFSTAGLRVTRAAGEPAADALEVATALDALAVDADGNDQRNAYRARLGATAGSVPQETQSWTRKLAVRSAAGLAATVGVVAVASEYVNGRATAVMPENGPRSAAAAEIPEAAPAMAAASADESEIAAIVAPAAASEVWPSAATEESPVAVANLEAVFSAEPGSAKAPETLGDSYEVIIDEAGLSLRADPQSMLASLEPIVVIAEPFEPLAAPLREEDDVLMAYFAPDAALSSPSQASEGAKHRKKGAAS